MHGDTLIVAAIYVSFLCLAVAANTEHAMNVFAPEWLSVTKRDSVPHRMAF